MKPSLIISFLLLFVIIGGRLSAQENLIYISPGITFGWNSKGSFSISPKFSLGIASRAGYYVNITFGAVGTLGRSPYRYAYIEFQGGSGRYFSSVGAGIAFIHKNGNTEIAPKLSLSAGLLLYANCDIVFPGDSVNTNTGLQAVAPIIIKGKLFLD